MLLCQQYVPNLVLYCLKRNSPTFRGAEMFFFTVQPFPCRWPVEDHKAHLSDEGCFHLKQVPRALAGPPRSADAQHRQRHFIHVTKPTSELSWWARRARWREEEEKGPQENTALNLSQCNSRWVR